MTAKKKANYINNKDLLAETILSLEKGEMTDKLARMLMMLVARYAKKRIFTNYTYNDDMQAYALMMLVRTWKSFDPNKSSNAFAFFTQCVKNSFIQYLNQERRQRDIRDEILVQNDMDPSYTYANAYKERIHGERKFAEDEENPEIQETKKPKEVPTEEPDSLLGF